MLTVGEMVGDCLGVVDWNDRPGDRIADLEWRNALRDLGIWDAKVLDKRVEEDDFGDYALSHLTQAEARRTGLRYGQSVRVIVLKEE